MANLFISSILDLLNLKGNRLSLMKNTDRFFCRKEVQEELMLLGVRIVSGHVLDLRIDFELHHKANKEQNSCYLIDNKDELLEDMVNEGVCIEFKLGTCFAEYSAKAIQNCSLDELHLLYYNRPAQALNEKETAAYLDQCVANDISDKDHIKKQLLIDLKSIATLADVNWDSVISFASRIMLTAIKEGLWDDIKQEINGVNERFQIYLENNFKAHIVPSSSAKRPRIVSNVLPFINFNYTPKQKIALVVVDGMSYWQYLMLSAQLGNDVESVNETIYSWIPSITQLSRQAIFRGSAPNNHYKQDPTNESKLWSAYWRGKGIQDNQIRYDYKALNDNDLTNICRLALVDDALDNKMHASDDYGDLYVLTQNWIENTSIVPSIHRLLSDGFVVFITTDHGNVKARSLGYLGFKEKLGTNKSGSRSLRHLEYADSWLKEQFLANHTEWLPFLGQDNNTIFLKNDCAFYTEGSIVAHGGSHFLEVLIPFVTLKKTNK
jgi:hypothetical protein